MQRKWVFVTVFFLQLLLFGAHAYAHTYTDDMGNTVSNSDEKTYYNLSVFSFKSSHSWNSLDDNTFATFANISNPVGRVVYTMQGAEQITVGIYTHAGTFVCKDTTRDNIYTMGVTRDGITTQRPSPSTQALYSPSSRSVYTQMGAMNSLYKKLFYDNYYEFAETSERPSDLINFGVNVYVSADGSAYQRISLQPLTLKYYPQAVYCFEEFTGKIPGGTKKIMVEINDMSSLPDKDGSTIPKTTYTYTSLARATVVGDKLVVGNVKEEENKEGESSGSSGSAGTSENSGNSGSSSELLPESVAPDPTPPIGTSTNGGVIVYNRTINSSSKSSSSKQSSSSKIAKFEGSIVASTQQSQTKRSSEASSKAASKSQSPLEPVTIAEDQPVALVSGAEAVLYQTPAPEASGDRVFRVGITVYIVAVCAAMLFVVLRPSR